MVLNNYKPIVKRVIATYYPKEFHASHYDFNAPFMPGRDTVKLEIEFYNAPHLVTTYEIMRDDTESMMEMQLKHAVESLIRYVKNNRTEESSEDSSKEVDNNEQSTKHI